MWKTLMMRTTCSCFHSSPSSWPTSLLSAAPCVRPWGTTSSCRTSETQTTTLRSTAQTLPRTAAGLTAWAGDGTTLSTAWTPLSKPPPPPPQPPPLSCTTASTHCPLTPTRLPTRVWASGAAETSATTTCTTPVPVGPKVCKREPTPLIPACQATRRRHSQAPLSTNSATLAVALPLCTSVQTRGTEPRYMATQDNSSNNRRGFTLTRWEIPATGCSHSHWKTDCK